MRKAKNKLFLENTNRDSMAYFVLVKTNTRKLIMISERMKVAASAIASTNTLRGYTGFAELYAASTTLPACSSGEFTNSFSCNFA